MPPRDQYATWRAILTDTWWWQRQCEAVSAARPKVGWGVAAGTKGRRAVYAHRVRWVLVCWRRQYLLGGEERWLVGRLVAGWKCRGVSRDAALVAGVAAGLVPCPKCELADALEQAASQPVPDPVHST